MFRRKAPKARLPVGGIRNLFHGVAIEPANDVCCTAARALKSERFLSEDAPLLPLENCDRRDQCRCRYRHFSDRRTELRRDTDEGLPPRLYPEDKRSGGGRRITDD